MSEPGFRATIRNPVEADEPQLVELLFRAFHQWPQFELGVPAVEHLRWKLRSDPISARHQWVAEIDGRIVATILRIIRRVRVRGRDYLARDNVDAAVDPCHQSQGLYGAIMDHALERFEDRTDGFFDEAARSFDFLVVQSKEYMNWRYCDPAAGRFTVRVAEHEGSILGYLVLKVSKGVGYIADLLALPERTDVARSLIEDALRLFREADVERVNCWMISRHPYNGILRRHGFVNTGKNVGFAYWPVNPDDEAFDFMAETAPRIHLTHGDSDWI